MKSEITITAGWSGDALYTLDDVNKLIRGVRRHTSAAHEFVLYAGRKANLDGLESGVTVIPSDYPSWWVGMQGGDPDNRPWIKTDAILGIGLDCVIVGSLDDIIRYPSNMAAMKDYPSHSCPQGRGNDCSMEVTLIRDNADRPMWDAYVRAGKPTWDMSESVGKPFGMCAQGWINATRAVHVDLFPENWVTSYKLGVKDRGLPEDCRIVSFHGWPKPCEVDEEWVKKHWY